MKLPGYKKIVKTDYEEKDQDLIETLGFSLNDFLASVQDLVNNNKISLKDNISCIIKELTVIVDSSGNPTSSVSFSVANGVRVLGFQVIFANNSTNSLHYPTGGIFISWSQSQNSININNITGLIANESFFIRTIIYT